MKDRYHKGFRASQCAVTIADQASAYLKAIKYTKIDPAIVVLGGFASPGSLLAFENFTGNIFPDAKALALDINPKPLKDTKAYSPGIPLLQADLCNLPFKQSSIDLLILDYTLNFMNPTQIRKFFSSAADIVTPNGLILAAHIDITNSPFSRRVRFWIERKIHRKPYHFHRTDQLLANAYPFSPVFTGEIPYKYAADVPVDIIAFRKSVILGI